VAGPLERFLALLERGPDAPERVFNPWRDHDERDRAPRLAMPRRRLDNLSAYVDARRGSARYMLMGEAPSHRGCRFSGIAFCSEHELVHKGDLVARAPLALTSRDADVKPFKERSAHVIWDEIAHAGAAYDVMLWNTFPWHPYLDAVTTNRKPKLTEVAHGRAAVFFHISCRGDGNRLAGGRFLLGLGRLDVLLRPGRRLCDRRRDHSQHRHDRHCQREHLSCHFCSPVSR